MLQKSHLHELKGGKGPQSEGNLLPVKTGYSSSHINPVRKLKTKLNLTLKVLAYRANLRRRHMERDRRDGEGVYGHRNTGMKTFPKLLVTC